MPDWGALIRSATLPLLGAATGLGQAASRQTIDMGQFNQLVAESAERKRQQAANRAQWEALRTITGGTVPPEQINAAEAAGLDPSMITSMMNQYQITPGGEVAEFPPFGVPRKVEGLQFQPRTTTRAPGAPPVSYDARRGVLVHRDTGEIVIPSGLPPLPTKPIGTGRADHYEERRVDQKEGALRVLFTQRRNALINALNPEQVKTQLPAIDEQIAAGIEDLPPARQARWRKLLAKAQQTTAEPPPPATPVPTPEGPGLIELGKGKLRQWLSRPTAAPTPAPEDTKTINGKTYVKIGGQWYEQ